MICPVAKTLAATLFILCLYALPADARDRILDIQEVTSPAGITAWLVEDHTLPLVALQFSFKGAGAAVDSKDKQGLSQLASNTLDEGAGPYDSQSFQKALADNSISFSFFSTRDEFGATFKTLTRHKALGFDLIRFALMEPRFEADAVARMKAANIARLRSSLSDPEWIAARILNDAAYAGHPYAMNAGGTLSTLQSLTPEDLKDFVKTRLAKDRLLVTVTGDISARELGVDLDKIFGALPQTSALPPTPEGFVKNGGKTFLYEMDIPQTIIEIMQPGIDHKDSDYYSAVVMNYILGGGGFGSRLMDSIREKRGLTYGIYSGLMNLDHVKTITISTSTKNETAGDLMVLAKQELTRMRDTKVTEKELTDAKAYLTGSMPLSLTSTHAIAGTMLNMRSEGLPVNYLDEYSAHINAVTIDDVQRVAKRLLVPDNLTVVLTGKPQGVAPTDRVKTPPNVD